MAHPGRFATPSAAHVALRWVNIYVPEAGRTTKNFATPRIGPGHGQEGGISFPHHGAAPATLSTVFFVAAALPCFA